MNSQIQQNKQNDSFSECLRPDFIPMDIHSTSEILPKLKVYYSLTNSVETIILSRNNETIS